MGKIVITVSGLLAVIGLALILSSPTMGLHAANSWLSSIGGSVDTARFQGMVTAYSEAYRLLGAVLLGGGMYGAYHQIRDTFR